MSSKYWSSALPQKNPKVCKSDQLPAQILPNGDSIQIAAEICWYQDIGSGFQANVSVNELMCWNPVDSSWLMWATRQCPQVKAEYEIHPDELHGKLSVAMLLNGGIIATYATPWLPLESRHPLDSGRYRCDSPSGDRVFTFQITG